MKKLLLTISVVAMSYMSTAQIIVRGISPNSIAYDYQFTWADPSNSSGWATPDFNITGTYVQDTLKIVEDGSTGTNAQGHPISQEGCNTLTNNLTSKIAVIYRNTCNFSTKALNAQNAGAVAVIIINRDPESVSMGAGTDGANVTIPVVMLSSIDGAALISAIANGPVEMFIGNKQNLFVNDGGASKDQALISRYGSIPLSMANNNYSFGVGLQMYNFGSANNNFTINAEITNPSGLSVYNNTINSAPIVSGDTLAAFNGNTYSFPDYTMSNAVIGKYTLTYTITVDGQNDDSNYDNVLSSSFYVTDDVLSLARQDTLTGKVLVNSFPSNATSSYQACMMLQDVYPNATTGIAGLYFSVQSDSVTIANEPVLAEIFEWNDAWTEIGTAWSNITFNDINSVGTIDYVCSSNNDNGKVVYAPFPSAVLLNDNQRYLACLTTYNSEIAFGYDNGITYDGNVGIYSQPISPLNIDAATTWFSGWSGVSAFSLGLKLISNAGIADLNSVDGVAYPNPANDKVTVSIDAEGLAKLTVSDISGKITFLNDLNLVNGKADVNISTLDAGIYVFNIVLEDGKTSQFNVVKK